MSAPTRYRAIVLDIEGTVGSISHVHDVLFPYARERFAAWLREHRGTEAADELLARIREHAGDAGLDEAGAVAVLTAWSDQDVKAPLLKTLQARIWAAGYADGSLHGHVYAEVPGMLRHWRREGARLYVYSSGAIPAQRDWFAHTGFGDLTPLISGYFDLTSAGGKRDPRSYRRIAAALESAPARILFLSDSAEELDAAAAAGWHTVGVRRAEDPRPYPVPGHRTVRALDTLGAVLARPAAPCPGGGSLGTIGWA